MWSLMGTCMGNGPTEQVLLNNSNNTGAATKVEECVCNAIHNMLGAPYLLSPL